MVLKPVGAPLPSTKTRARTVRPLSVKARSKALSSTRSAWRRRRSGPYNYFDPAWHPYYHGTPAHSMQSVSKTVTATVIRIATARGDFKASLDTPALQYFDAARVKHVDERKRRMMLKHVLTMSTARLNENLPYDDPHNPTGPWKRRATGFGS